MRDTDLNALARVIIEDRIREADHRHLARQMTRPELSTARIAITPPQPFYRMWDLVRLPSLPHLRRGLPEQGSGNSPTQSTPAH